MKYIDRRNILHDSPEWEFVPYSAIVQEIYEKEQAEFWLHMSEVLKQGKGGKCLEGIDYKDHSQGNRYGTNQK